MEARIVREELQKCHKAEGVNHYQACSDLAKKYHSLLADAKVSTKERCVCGEIGRKNADDLAVGVRGGQVKGFRVIDTA